MQGRIFCGKSRLASPLEELHELTVCLDLGFDFVQTDHGIELVHGSRLRPGLLIPALRALCGKLKPFRRRRQLCLDKFVCGETARTVMFGNGIEQKGRKCISQGLEVYPYGHRA